LCFVFFAGVPVWATLMYIFFHVIDSVLILDVVIVVFPMSSVVFSVLYNTASLMLV